MDPQTTPVYRPDREGCRFIYDEGLPKMSPVDIRAMLLDASGHLKYRLLNLDTSVADKISNPIVSAIEEKADGLPLYVHLVIQDVCSGEKHFNDDLPNQLPEGLPRYYLELVRRFELGPLPGLLPPLMGTIAWAEEPLDEEALLEFMRRRTAVSLSDEREAARELAQGLAALGGVVRPVSRRRGGRFRAVPPDVRRLLSA